MMPHSFDRFAFIKYEDQRSTDLAVDNFNGVKVLGRTIRVDHKLEYNAPKKKKEDRDGTEGAVKFEPGKAYEDKELANGASRTLCHHTPHARTHHPATRPRSLLL